MKVVSPPPVSADPLLRLVRRAMMEEARAELIKARLEKRRVSQLGRAKRRGRNETASAAPVPLTSIKEGRKRRVKS